MVPASVCLLICVVLNEQKINQFVQDEMLPPEHMARMHKMLLAQQGRVTWVPLRAGHMDAYETAAQVSHLSP